MDVLLIAIAALSLSLAIGMGVILVRVLRDERRRSDARVAILARAAGDADLPLASPFVEEPIASDPVPSRTGLRSEEHTSELQSQSNLVCRLLLEKKKH